MVVRTHRQTVTFNEFMELIRDDEKADLIEGVIYMASPDNVEHNEDLAWLAKLLGVFAEMAGLAGITITVNRVAYRLSPNEAPEPDIAVLLPEHRDRVRKGYVIGPPDIAIEIVSPSSVDRDYKMKRRQYEKGGVREYWIFDPDEKRSTFLVREGDRFVEVPTPDGVFASRVLPVFRLDTRWLWQQPRPPTIPLVQAMIEQGRGE